MDSIEFNRVSYFIRFFVHDQKSDVTVNMGAAANFTIIKKRFELVLGLDEN